MELEAKPSDLPEGAPATARTMEYDREVSEPNALRRIAERARFLTRASAELASSLDYAETVGKVARLAIPLLADWSVVHGVEADGSLALLAVCHRDPAMEQFAQELWRRYPSSAMTASLVQVLEIGNPQLLADLPEEMVLAVAEDDEHRELLRKLRFVSAMCLPLQVRGRKVGILTLLCAESQRRLGAEELDMATDLAHHAALALENARLYREAQEAVRVRDEFLSIAAHELRTPLTTLQIVLQSTLRRLRSEPERPPAPEAIASKIENGVRQVERISMLITGLLDLSRIASRRLALDLEELDLAALAQEVADRFADPVGRPMGRPMDKAGCALRVHADGPVWGTWDRLRLDQVLTNLLTNAMKYGRGNPIELIVSAEGDRATVRVRDRGIGIPAEHLSRIFERFERAVPSRNYGGLGLGLWISRQFVQVMGGEIRVESRIGVGSTFTVKLPLRSPAAPPRV